MSATPTSERADWLEKLLSPSSVALVGASNDPQHTGGRIIGYLDRYGYKGKVFPVNPMRDVVQGLRSYPSVAAIGEPVDIAFITVPASQVARAVAECGQSGVPLAYVGSSGFAEVGGEGAALQEELTTVAKQAGVRVLGPNGNGIISVRSGFAACFMSGLDQDRYALTDGRIALVSQSGAIGSFVFSMGQASGLGIGTFISTGNEIDLTFEEVLFRLLDDEQTQIVLGYVEGLRDAPTFVEAAHYAERLGKAIVLLKVGTTPEGATAAASHTAALVGEDRAYDGILSQLGVLRAHTLGHLLDIARLLARFGPQIGRRMTIVTLSGGVGIMLSDLASRHGMALATWPSDLQARVHECLPSWCSSQNPIDTTGVIARDHTILRQLLELADENSGSDFTAVALGNFETAESAASTTLLDLSARLNKPIMPIWIAGSGVAIDKLNRGGLPSFTEPRSLIEAASVIANRHTPSRVPGVAHQALPGDVLRVIEEARSTETLVLDEIAGKEILNYFRIPTVPYYEVASESHLNAATAYLGFPLVAKLKSRRLTHKSEHGAVLANLTNRGHLSEALRYLQSLADELQLDDARVVLQRQVVRGAELLLGMATDPVFGPVLTLGIGGTQTEAIDDVQIRLPPIDQTDVAHVLRCLHHQRYLRGFRGSPIVTAEVIGPIVCHFARLVCGTAGHFDSIDLNPVIVHEPGPVVSVVDALFVVSKT